MSLSTLDWMVVAVSCVVSLGVGLLFTKSASKEGEEGFFTAHRSLPWWAIGFSNCATYQSGGAGFVMLVLVFGLAGNWLWWASWIMWMPLVAVIWAPLWRRMRVVTTAELITLRYGDNRASYVARKIYALMMFGISVLVIAYITGAFSKTLAPLVTISEKQTLLIFGGITVLYSMFGGLGAVVFVDVIQFFILMSGVFAFIAFAVPQFGGWDHILQVSAGVREQALQQFPPVKGVDMLSTVMLVILGVVLAGSPTAGEGMTAQRFMAAKNEKHAIGGQLFNSFLALSFRTIPLIVMGIIAIGLFWTEELQKNYGPAPKGLIVLKDSMHAWGELINLTKLPNGMRGLLVSVEIAAFMSTLASLINWGSSFLINDFLKAAVPNLKPKAEIWSSRLASLLLFAFAGIIAMKYVNSIVDWFMFINSAMVSFILPLAVYRFFWGRFNVWGELAATVIGLPLSIIIWFVLGFKDQPYWQGLGILFVSGAIVQAIVALLTPATSPDVCREFYRRCRPFGLWAPFNSQPGTKPAASGIQILRDSMIGVLTCLGLVVATNALLIKSWPLGLAGLFVTIVFGAMTIIRSSRIAQDDEESVQAKPGSRTSEAETEAEEAALT